MGDRADPQARRGLKSLSHSQSRLKPTEQSDSTMGDRADPQARRGLKSPSHSKSRLKPTEQPDLTIADFSPLSEDLSYETGISIPVGL
ncbi:MAG: hypothetical protein QQW96_07755 [Tychonema bourrellyi B0820]|nr:hypothetical protein [Tychonema bourrellyi B0820]